MTAKKMKLSPSGVRHLFNFCTTATLAARTPEAAANGALSLHTLAALDSSLQIDPRIAQLFPPSRFKEQLTWPPFPIDHHPLPEFPPLETSRGSSTSQPQRSHSTQNTDGALRVPPKPLKSAFRRAFGIGNRFGVSTETTPSGYTLRGEVSRNPNEMKPELHAPSQPKKPRKPSETNSASEPLSPSGLKSNSES
jgi:hypothetical protein